MHVLTGPDHLSALATLSANVGSVPQAFFLGVRWGLGHSTGLLLVGVAFILLSRHSKDDTVQVPDRLTLIFEGLVGVFMILLGIYGVRRAWEKRPKAYSNIPTTDVSSQATQTSGMQQDGSEACTNEDCEYAVPHHHQHGDSYHHHISLHHAAFSVDATDNDSFALSTQNIKMEDVDVSSFGCFRTLIGRITKISTRTMAVCAGVIHGLAGPGGVLGVIPAVQLHNARLAAIYLGSFCVSSTLTMGVFAILYGTCSSRLVDREASNTSRRELRIECISASLSILVGLLWLTLLSIGKLEDVFP